MAPKESESCLDYIFCQGEVEICGCWLSTWRRGREPAGIYIQPWKWPLGPLTCGMNALPYKSPHRECLNIPNWSPNRPLNSMRGLQQPGQASHMWRIATIFVGPSCVCINICQKCVDNICQSGSQVFASPAHPSALDNHTLSDGPRTENPEDQYVLCCNIKLFGFEMFWRWCSFQIGFHSKSK